MSRIDIPRNCPYPDCGSDDVSVEYDEHDHSFVICRKCGCRGPRRPQPSHARISWDNIHELCFSAESVYDLKGALRECVEKGFKPRNG